MSEDDIEKRIQLEQCEVRCVVCGVNWVTSLGVEYCNCLHCGRKLVPKKHLVVQSEDEIQ
jgi:hypothetical protein